MGATFQNRWEENQKKLYSKEAEGKARGKNKKAFTRKRKMPVCDIIISIMTSKKQTCAMELRNFFKLKDREEISYMLCLLSRKKSRKDHSAIYQLLYSWIMNMFIP